MASLEQITTLAHGEDVPALLACCEAFELDLGHTTLAPDMSRGVYKVHLVVYFLCQQLDNARFLWKRLPVEARDPELNALWEIGKALWVSDAAAAQAAMVAHVWSPPLVSGLVTRLQREHLQRSFRQFAKAYSIISGEALAKALGVPVATVHEMANAANWTTDAESGAYVPVVPEEPPGKPALLEQLSVLTDFVSHIEKEVK